MTIKRVTNFGVKETPEERTRKLNDMLASIYRILNDIIADLDDPPEPPEEPFFGHSSSMPDLLGFNKDHDKRYISRLELGAKMSQFVTELTWQFSGNPADTDPGAKRFSLNNATQDNATFIYVNKITDSGSDVSLIIQTIKANDKIYIQDRALGSSARNKTFKVTGDPVLASAPSNYWKIPVIIFDAGTDFINLTSTCNWIVILRGL